MSTFFTAIGLLLGLCRFLSMERGAGRGRVGTCGRDRSRLGELASLGEGQPDAGQIAEAPKASQCQIHGSAMCFSLCNYACRDPETAAHFRATCTRELGSRSMTGKPFHDVLSAWKILPVVYMQAQSRTKLRRRASYMVV
ncbi:hypothetical protein [Hoeflea marina]|uniref:hypothetical protein n=1 Tax=Hoeflea marina TaxID=274592 RepID=UPI0011B623AC|nr:hypothetical protein [Hoeflea marina]